MAQGKEWEKEIKDLTILDLEEIEEAFIVLNQWKFFTKEFVGIGQVQGLIHHERMQRSYRDD